MIASLGLLATLLAPQDTLGLSDRARAMLDRFVPPVNGEVTVATRFSDDTVWIGEQVELVTAIWFPRDLRQRLRRQPSLRSPAVAGMWSAPTSVLPELAETRRVSGVVLDLYVSHQTLFPLDAGTVTTSPASLTYAVPSSSSFFAPEERREVASRPARLVVRPIPAALAARLGSGPTAREMRLAWEVPPGGVTTGTPVTVALVLSGRGNVALWPEPEVNWPANVRVYAEPTDEVTRRPSGTVTGEKRFRFTLVTDDPGVLTLPRVRYPHFDPQRVQVAVATATPVGLAVQPSGSAARRMPVAASRVLRTPVAAVLVRQWWPALALMALAAPLIWWLRRRRRPGPVSVTTAPTLEGQLRLVLGRAADATPRRVESALRRRGASRDEARAVRDWLEGLERHRWAAGHPPRPDDASAAAVLARLRRGAGAGVTLLLLMVSIATPAGAQWEEALARYRDNDAVAAERLFTQVAVAHPASPDAWLDLGAARWLAGDDVGSVAAWLQGLRVAPRDARLHAALAAVPSVPTAVRRMVPVIPFSRDELVLVALFAWMVAWGTWRRFRRIGQASAGLVVLAGGLALGRSVATAGDRALVRPDQVLRVSPVMAAPAVGSVPSWTTARLERRARGWWLVETDGAGRGWIPESGVAPLSPLD